jgi:hypothetical protein
MHVTVRHTFWAVGTYEREGTYKAKGAFRLKGAFSFVGTYRPIFQLVLAKSLATCPMISTV